MNWRAVEENWMNFIEEFNLQSERLKKNYIHGYQDIYRATEYFHKFEIFYENKINKSSNYGSLFGHSMLIYTPIHSNPQIKISISKTHLWRWFLFKEKKIQIKREGDKVENLLPLNDIEELFKTFPNSNLSINVFDKHGNKGIKIGQEVLQIKINDQPKKLEQLKLIRYIMVKILVTFIENGRIKART